MPHQSPLTDELDKGILTKIILDGLQTHDFVCQENVKDPQKFSLDLPHSVGMGTVSAISERWQPVTVASYLSAVSCFMQRDS